MLACNPIHYSTNVEHAIQVHRQASIKLSMHPNSLHHQNYSRTNNGPDLPSTLTHQPIHHDHTSLVLTATANGSLQAARSVHAAILKSCIKSEPNMILHNHILNMYGKCGSTCDVQQAFDSIPQPDIVSWNILIARYACSGFHHSAQTVFSQMQAMGLRPDSFTLSTLIRVAVDIDNVRYGASLHGYAIKLECYQQAYVAAALISMYAKCGYDSSAQLFFQHLERLDLAIFNSMISAFARNQDSLGALKLFAQMKEVGISPDHVTFLSSLKAATTGNGNLPLGSQIHAHVVKMGGVFESAVSISSSLIIMYASHGEIDNAYRIFISQQPSNNLVLWTAIINGLTHNGKETIAIDLFRNMQDLDIEFDGFIYESILQACTAFRSIKQGQQVHARIVRIGFMSDTWICNRLIDFYGKCQRAEDGLKVFYQIGNCNSQSWTQAILLCLQDQAYHEALEFFVEMIFEGMEIEQSAVITVIQACTNFPEAQSGKQVHGFLHKLGFQSEIQIASALVTFYSRHGMLGAAQTVFDQIMEADAVLWTALISAYDENGYGKSALELFGKMVNAGSIPDAFTFATVLSSCAAIEEFRGGGSVHAYAIKGMATSDLIVSNALISLYSECGMVDLAYQVFHQMPDHDVISWATMIAGYTLNGQPDESQKLFTQMQRDRVTPDELVISGMLNACSSLASLSRGRRFHAFAIQLGFASMVPVCNSLITMYSRCGNINKAYSIFQEMVVRNIVSWNTMISGLAQNGRSRDALQLFEKMQEMGIQPNATTFTAILSACSYDRLLHKGQQYFNMMRSHYGLKPTEDHYSCMIDLFSRVGKLDQAMDFISKMPFSPDDSAWTAFLSGCRIHRKMELGELAAERLIKMRPNNSAAYVLLANMYAEAGQWENVRAVRERMGSRGLKKEPACSWIEIKNQVHVFAAHDISHGQTDEIHRVSKHLHMQMRIND